MSAVLDRRTKDAVKAALGNKIVLWEIFSYLPIRDLKQCRLVNGRWYCEATSFVREFRRCDAQVPEDSPCSALLALAELVSGMSIVPINSLSIELTGSSHQGCKLEANWRDMFFKLLEKLPLKHLYISWDEEFSNLDCPAVSFVIDLLRRKLVELSTLEFGLLPDEFYSYFGKVWVPWLPKLAVLDICDLIIWEKQRKLCLKIIDGSPNLKKLKGNDLSAGYLDYISAEKYSLLDKFLLSVESDGEEKKCSMLALAEPALSSLSVAAPSEACRRYKRSFIYVLEKLLSSSLKSLETFCMESPIFPLNLLAFPPLVNVKKMSIYADETTPHLVHVLRATDYTKLLPALFEVKIAVDSEFDPNDVIVNHYEDEEAAQLVQLHPSATVKNLDVCAEFNSLTFAQLSEIFPHVVTLELDAGLMHPFRPNASAVWTDWPHLESVSIADQSGALKWNFDAEFLGIDSEEVEILRQLHDESLEKMNIVPVRPSVLTVLRLKKLQIGLCLDHEEVEVAPDQVFLSKLTAILAFKKMAKKGVEIQIIFKDPQAALRLNHLSQYVSFVHKF